MCDIHNLTDSAGDGDAKRNEEQPEIITKVIEYLDEDTVRVIHENFV